MVAMQSSCEAFQRQSGLLVRALAVAVVVVMVRPIAAGAEITTALGVRSLTPEQADEAREVRLQAVVTCNDSPTSVFVQDETAGVFFRPGKRVALEPGDRIEITGRTQSALYVPGIAQASFRLIGRGPPIQAAPVSYVELESGRFHYQWVSVEGIVRAIFTGEEGRTWLRLVVGAHVLDVLVRASHEASSVQVDSRVRIRGLASGRINFRRQMVRPYLQSSGWHDVDEIEPALPVRELRSISTAELLNFTTAGHAGRRVQMRGRVLGLQPDGIIYVRDAKGAAEVRLANTEGLAVGDEIAVAGFPEMSRFSAALVDAELLDRRDGTPPLPVETTVPALFAGEADGELVSVVADVIEWVRDEAGVMLFLNGGPRPIRVRVPSTMTAPEVGARVRVTGICQIEPVFMSRDHYRSLPGAVTLLVRQAADVAVMRSPPWWTVRRLSYVLASVCALGAAGLAWILVLRRQVRRQTDALRHRIEREAAFEERQRLARDFHDTLEQDLTGMSLQLGTAVARGFDERGRGLVDDSRTLLERVQRETRMLISDLRGSELQTSGQVDIAGMLQEIAKERMIADGPSVAVETAAVPIHIPAQAAYHLRMIVQELITNVLKHARATAVRLQAELRAGALLLVVRDDGTGFDPEPDSSGRPGHYGCVGIRERCLKIGATVLWTSAPGMGTTVEVSLPVSTSLAPGDPAG